MGIGSVKFNCVYPSECDKCPAGTEPILGFEYKWWNQMPANMKSLVSGEHSDFEGQVGKSVPFLVLIIF